MIGTSELLKRLNDGGLSFPEGRLWGWMRNGLVEKPSVKFAGRLAWSQNDIDNLLRSIKSRNLVHCPAELAIYIDDDSQA